ncbi:melanopsin-like [Acanthaster planci]|uniref:Melanopsin-like n=1 Tax=Acanthaster planci TaxID=133434 RepID=A0A8B7YB39_ACAPL|nr:melanopsin-like [Acanthaster planci]
MEANSTILPVSHLSVPLRALHGTTVIIADILGIIGNLLVIISIAKTPELHTSHNAFVLNLSMSDLLLSVFTVPFYVLAILAEGWPLSSKVCRFKAKFSLILWEVSLLTLAAVATNRYFLVAKSSGTYSRFCSRKQIIFAVLVFWLESLLVALFSEFAIEVDIQYLPAFSCCVFNPLDPTTYYFVMVFICIFVVSVLIIVPVQYFRVLLVIRASGRRVGRAVSTGPCTNDQHQLSCQNRPNASGITKDEIRLLKMFVLLSFFHVISYIPISIVYLFGVTSPMLFQGARFGMFILSTTVAINPILYAWMNQKIRHACCRLLKSKKRVFNLTLGRQMEQAQYWLTNSCQDFCRRTND